MAKDLKRMTDEEYYAYIESKGHTLRRETDETVDAFYLDYDDPEGWGGHNGPGCTKCEETWCEHCRYEVSKCSKS